MLQDVIKGVFLKKFGGFYSVFYVIFLGKLKKRKIPHLFMKSRIFTNLKTAVGDFSVIACSDEISEQ